MSATQEKNGRWMVKYRRKDGTPTTKRGFKTKREALEYEFMSKRQDADSRITLNELFQEKYESDTTRLRPNTLKNNRLGYNNHIKPFLGDKLVCDITPLDIRKWQDELARHNYSPHTIFTYNTLLKGILNYAMKYRNLAKNPFSVTGKTGKQIRRSTVLDINDFNKIMEVTKNAKHRLIFAILFCSGMRVGELLALTKDNIDITNNTISITHSKDDHFGEGPTKNDSSVRTITMPASIINELARHIPDEGYIFPMTASNIRWALHTATKKAGVPDVTAHGLRHSHASLLISENVDVVGVSSRLGHSSGITTLRTYAHAYRKKDGEIAKLLEKTHVGHLLVKSNSPKNKPL